MSRKRFILGFAFWVFACVIMSAQEKNQVKPKILTNLADDSQGGQIEVIQPAQVEKLLKMQISNNQLQKGIHGYRIQIFSLSGQTARQKSDEARMNFMKNFPELEAYQDYTSPYWRIFVGDFRTKNEALREKKNIEKIFPGAFIVSEIINIPK